MEAKKFIIKKLQELHTMFPMLSIKYKYDEYTLMHLVDIMPLIEYENNQEYIKFETDLSFEFDNMFYPHSVMFVSADSLTKVSNPELTIDPVVIENFVNDTCVGSSGSENFTVGCLDCTFKVTNNNYSLAA